MAHNLAKNADGTYKMAFSGQTPWHGLGKQQNEMMTSEQALREAGLNYEVGLLPVKITIEGKDYVVPDRFATYRKDINLPFCTVGSKYTVIQNTEAFKFIDSVLGRKEAVIETAGALFNGEKVFITCKLPNNIRMKGTNDIIENFLVLVNDFTGSDPLYALFTPVRVVCHNTVNAAMRDFSNKYTIRHTVSSKLKLDFGQEILGVYNTYSQQIETIFNKMIDTKYDIRDFLNTLYLTSEQIKLVESNNGILDDIDEISTQKKNLISDIEIFYHSGIGQDMKTCKGTVYGAFQAVTGYIDNIKTYKSIEDKMNSVIFGTGEKYRQNAFTLAENLVLS